MSRWKETLTSDPNPFRSLNRIQTNFRSSMEEGAGDPFCEAATQNQGSPSGEGSTIQEGLEVSRVGRIYYRLGR